MNLSLKEVWKMFERKWNNDSKIRKELWQKNSPCVALKKGIIHRYPIIEHGAKIHQVVINPYIQKKPLKNWRKNI